MLPTHHGTRVEGELSRGASLPGEAGSVAHVGTVRKDTWRPPRLSRPLAVIPSNPRFKSFQIIVKAMSRHLPRRGKTGGAPSAKLEPKETADHRGDGKVTEEF